MAHRDEGQVMGQIQILSHHRRQVLGWVPMVILHGPQHHPRVQQYHHEDVEAGCDHLSDEEEKPPGRRPLGGHQLSDLAQPPHGVQADVRQVLDWALGGVLTPAQVVEEGPLALAVREEPVRQRQDNGQNAASDVKKDAEVVGDPSGEVREDGAAGGPGRRRRGVLLVHQLQLLFGADSGVASLPLQEAPRGASSGRASLRRLAAEFCYYRATTWSRPEEDQSEGQQPRRKLR
mmetsp:Transcript_46820/g.100120  ORF Transcript_46820/g.100120 Transcript_46820/m.100120 type:complete len:233 (+) Transcript_46820:861-1559(+)